MTTKIAINGFGRIGRLVLRAMIDQGLLEEEFEVVAINDLVPADNLAYLLKYDSVQGPLQNVSHRLSSEKGGSGQLIVNGHGIEVLGVREGPKAMPWKDLGVDIVIESTGLFTAADLAGGHLEAGAGKVLITAPSKGEDIMVVMGVNDDLLDKEQRIISNASCTTNCLAPLVHVLLKEGIGLEEGLMTTVHSYTASQKTVDGPSAKDWRGGRAAALNIIPASTGAARAVAKVCPQVQGKLTGMAFRVPTPTVSVVDLTFRSERKTSLDEINQLMRHAADSYLAGILGYVDEEVVSSDFIRNPLSSIYDAGASIALNENFFKLVSWYDNEWGYANRVVDLARRVSEL